MPPAAETTPVAAATTAEAESSTVPPVTSTGDTHKIYFQNFMSPNYKRDEILLKKIINNHVSVKDRRDKIQLIIYYRSTKTRNLIMKNNLSPKVRDLARTNLIYDFRCIVGECAHQTNRFEVTYSGKTTCTLSRRLTFHLQNGAIKIHFLEKHGRKPTRDEIVKMTKARYYINDLKRLETLEAMIILLEEPILNRQDTGKTKVLKLFGTGNRSLSQLNLH